MGKVRGHHNLVARAARIPAAKRQNLRRLVDPVDGDAMVGRVSPHGVVERRSL